MEKSKRGRRPKIPVLINKTDNLNSDTPIIAHLPIDLSEVIQEQVNDIFIKPEYDSYNESETKMLRRKVEELTTRLNKYEKNIKASIVACSGDSKCWWDTHYFNVPSVKMPESYFNGIFNCIEYNYIKPPIISRISYIEKIPIKREEDIDIKNDELILKRNKPLKSSKYNLESIMGLKKIDRKVEFNL